ncbi:DUF6221 family protein [Streptomyces sp. NPDC101209]|uniref:DUF6221 family protein n=1 Tax=Streptomyces sp. NPDC101209 TaxID=3366129 RepID=UPI0037FDF6C8
MDDLVRFLRVRLLMNFLYARLDEDEQVARQATDGPWLAGFSGETGNCVIPADAENTREYVARTQLYSAAFDAEHIARHDPRRVLREIAAWRRILTYVDMQGKPYEFLPLIDPLARIWEDHAEFNPVWLNELPHR